MSRVAADVLPYTALRDAVLIALRAAIVEGKLQPGERLLEAEIAREFGTSRAPLREAIRQLESEGLVVSAPHRGTFVTKLSGEDAREIYCLRAAVEGMAAILVVRSGRTEILDRLDQLLTEMKSCVASGEVERVIQADFRFHEILCQAAGNARLLGVWLSMRTQIRAFVSATSQRYLKPSELVRRHCVVLEAMRAGDAQRAQWLLTGDILEVGEHVAARLAAVG